MQSIDLLSVHGYNFVNFREIMEMLLSCTAMGVPMTLEKGATVNGGIGKRNRNLETESGNGKWKGNGRQLYMRMRNCSHV